MCMYITFIGSLVIFIKKRVSRQITERIPKSNILPRHTSNQVRPSNEISTGDLFLPHQKYLDSPFLSSNNVFRVSFVIFCSSSNLDYKRKQNYLKGGLIYTSHIYSNFLDIHFNLRIVIG